MSFYKKVIEEKDEIYTEIRNEFNKHHQLKFIAVILVFLAYFIFISAEHGFQNGLLITMLTWSFFVFCTPIADAGILFDFPIRLITGLKMVYSEILIWVIAFGVNVIAKIGFPEIYQQNALLSILNHIITNPIPYGIIIIISGIGTFISLYLGDSLFNKHKQKKKHIQFLNKHKIAIFTILFIIIIPIYYILLKTLNVNI